MILFKWAGAEEELTKRSASKLIGLLKDSKDWGDVWDRAEYPAPRRGRRSAGGSGTGAAVPDRRGEVALSYLVPYRCENPACEHATMVREWPATRIDPACSTHGDGCEKCGADLQDEPADDLIPDEAE